MLALIEPLLEAVQRKDWTTVFRLAMGMRGKLSYDDVLQQVVGIADSRLRRLKDSYANWWTANSRMLRQRLNEFQRALFRAQTRLALRTSEEREPANYGAV